MTVSARRFELTPARLAALGRALPRMLTPELGRARRRGLALLASTVAGLMISTAGATWLAVCVKAAFGVLAIVFASMLAAFAFSVVRGLRRLPTLPCSTGELTIDDVGLRWHLDDGGAVEVDWLGVVAWTDDADAIYLLDTIGTGHVVPIAGDADAVQSTFLKRCPAARHVT